ncbi:MOSC domain-containing protein [Prescottella subtropica]|uniref:MOSC domain-containing protein n=1 Tax=Prescottella subtropica TaxID=2545757 RepID=UPI0010F97F00|nr:MOSC domain-containing protein [Prescottella subtropica]
MVSVLVEQLLTGRVRALPGEDATSGIYKTPVDGVLWLSETGFTGDEQADLRHHGGPEKAVHHYPADHLPFWRGELPGAVLGPGAFGENVSTTGVTEADVCVGDTFTVGTAIVQVSQGRQPCWKLDRRFETRGVSRRMQSVRNTGWYYRVLQPGHVQCGDRLELIDRPEPDWSIARILRLLFDRRAAAADEWAAVSRVDTLSPNWRETFASRVAKGAVEDWSSRLGAS